MNTFSSLCFALIAFLMSAVVIAANDMAVDQEGEAAVSGKRDPFVKKLIAKNRKDMKRYGYLKSRLPKAACEMVIDHMQKTTQRAVQKGKSPNRKNTGYMPLHKFMAKKHGMRIPPMPKGIVFPDSENFVAYNDVTVERVYTETVFGGLMVNQTNMKYATVEDLDPGLPIEHFDIGGFKARVIVNKHTEPGKWSTTIDVVTDEQSYTIESTRRLDGLEREEFKDFARTLIAS